MVLSSDADLVRAVLGGNRAMYAELYDRYAPLVRAVCHNTTRNLACAQDLSQEVFLKAYDRLRMLRDPDQFVAWLVGIARNECREWLRKRSREPYASLTSMVDVPAREAFDESEVTAVIEAMALLPKREWLALHVFYLQGGSADALRPLLGLSSSGVYRLLDRARRRLAKLLTQEGVR